MSGNVDKSIRIFSLWEILGFGIAVVLVLFLLYPEDKLKKYSEISYYKKLEEENLFLSIKYLEEIIKKYPDMKNARILLIYKYIQTGQMENARKALEDYEKIYGKDSSLLLLKYEILKKEAFSYPESSEKRKVLLKKMGRILLEEINRFEDPEFLNYFYKQAVLIGRDDVALKALLKLVKITDKKEWYKKAIKFAISTKNRDVALKLLKQGFFKFHDIFYAEKIIQLYLWKKEYRKAVSFIKEAVRQNIPPENKILLLEKGAEISIWTGRYREAAKFYIEAMRISKNRKSEFFVKALKTLRSGNRLKEAVKLIKKYGYRFIENRRVSKLMLKIALETGDLELARKISLKLLTGER
ncbi:tetratricopeptide repeat protein [Persephonella atlantica]|uniref:Tetratricopeptide repeat protein n=1 Tax=Persephonella atlantica TaxID=2699429 RepID=A0ABS1GHM0_9AQUI|nr:tetratricopeptide repeat protein [Persephonella atlantica]MBK3332331.1 tetratricopeptide repeat protein [Persephonella atlantica]